MGFQLLVENRPGLMFVPAGTWVGVGMKTKQYKINTYIQNRLVTSPDHISSAILMRVSKAGAALSVTLCSMSFTREFRRAKA